ncbi:heat shock protein Hsp20 [Planoprotostelium fungivorum]|uniref:Heat shock protein Hsp20 n=1 Tax=Planoprotostelium fungivorum TaxID=1890364 RepID=A0A2P6N5R6_9EUKA|nr:heat shock protein Hsp20 [Planoprotostelium fungivorum]
MPRSNKDNKDTKALSTHQPEDYFGHEWYSPFLALQTLKPLLNDKHWRQSHGLQRTEEGYLFEAEMAGVPKENVNIEVKDGQLHVSGKQRVEEEREGRRMYSRSDFYQSMSLPRDVDQNSVRASYTDGLLRVKMSRTEENNNTKRITIE